MIKNGKELEESLERIKGKLKETIEENKLYCTKYLKEINTDILKKVKCDERQICAGCQCLTKFDPCYLSSIGAVYTLMDKETIQEMKNNFSKDFCLSCGEEMRKWICDRYTLQCVSMCVNKECNQSGIVFESIKNINNFKLGLTIWL